MILDQLGKTPFKRPLIVLVFPTNWSGGKSKDTYCTSFRVEDQDVFFIIGCSFFLGTASIPVVKDIGTLNNTSATESL